MNRPTPSGAPRNSTDPFGTCRHCGRPIAFRETPSGALQPWDVDPSTGEPTTVHFATGPARQRAKREERLRQGKPAEVPLDRCHLPGCGSPELVFLAPTGEGGNGSLWASRCQGCGVHRYLPKRFTPPPGALPPEPPPPFPPGPRGHTRAWREAEWDWCWCWREDGHGWAWRPRTHEAGGGLEVWR
jgi:hypothetical protein